MKIVFMGTPEFARKPLVCLSESQHQVLMVVTGPDKQSGRGRRVMPTPCKAEAIARNIPVLTPNSLKSEELYEQLEALKADLFVVVAFRILPKSLFCLPKYGSINIHTSLLPKYRGAAPINWALVNGETETGLSSFYLKKKVDAGNLILQEKIAINPDDNYDILSEKMSQKAGPFLLKTLDLIEADQVKPILQDESLVSPARKLEPIDGLINFDLPTVQVHNQIRGMTSRPGAYTGFRGKTVKIKQACPITMDTITMGNNPVGQELINNAPQNSTPEPGLIIKNKKRLLVSCQSGILEITSLIPEGRKLMDGVSFINGFQPKLGEKFTTQDFVLPERQV